VCVESNTVSKALQTASSSGLASLHHGCNGMRRSVRYDLRDVCKFTVKKAKKGIKRRCIPVLGVQLWNNIEMGVRMVTSFLVFKGIIYKTILESYKCE